MPRLNAIPPGCAFNPRCPQALPLLPRARPDLMPAGASQAACWLHARDERRSSTADGRRMTAMTCPQRGGFQTPRMGAASSRPPASTAARRWSWSKTRKVFDVSAPWLNRVLERKPRQLLHAVDGVSLRRSRRGETLALVGESGCGKSTVARLLVGLYRPTADASVFDGTDLVDRSATGAAQASCAGGCR